MDEEIAMATLLERMADWVHGEGGEPYPLAEGRKINISRWPSKSQPIPIRR
jgi:hypothetical protein